MNYYDFPSQAPFVQYAPPSNALDYVDSTPLSAVVDASSPLPPNGFPTMDIRTFETMPHATGISESHLSGE